MVGVLTQIHGQPYGCVIEGVSVSCYGNDGVLQASSPICTMLTPRCIRHSRKSAQAVVSLVYVTRRLDWVALSGFIIGVQLRYLDFASLFFALSNFTWLVERREDHEVALTGRRR